MRGAQHQKKAAKSFEDISHYFLSAAEADGSHNVTGTAGHLEDSNVPPTSDSKPASPRGATAPARRRENCASCAHLIAARGGQPFQCRIYSAQHEEYKVARRERIDLEEGRTCPYFMRVTSRQLEDILRSHGSQLSSEQVREYAHEVDEQVILNKTITFSPRAGMTPEEVLREELLRYLVDGYSIVEATVTRKESHSEDKHSKTVMHKTKLRVKQEI